MAFNKTNAKSKHQFTARMVSNKTGATVTWINLVDEFTRKIFGVPATEVTAEEALESLPQILDNEHVSVVITDLTAEIEIISITEY